MSGCINSLIFRLPKGILDSYDTLYYSGILTVGENNDSLAMRVTPDNYIGVNPVEKTATIGYQSPVVVVRRNLYEFEATDLDSRAGVVSDVLADLNAIGGNLSIYGATNTTIDPCNEPLIALEDYHSLDDATARALGFTLRVGVVNAELVTGSWSVGNNLAYSGGCRVVFTQTHVLQNGALTVV